MISACRRPLGCAALFALGIVGLLAPPAAAQQLPPPDADPDGVRSEAERILDQRQFQPDEPNVVERVGDWVQDRISSLFDRLTGSGGGTILAWVLLFAAVTVIGVLVARALSTASLGRSTGAAAPHVVLEEALSLDELRAEAERAESAEEWKRALLARYRILIVELIERGRVAAVPGRTTGEYRAEIVSTSPTSADAFGEATDLFEAAWYGDEPTGIEENHRFRALTDRILGAVEVAA